MPREINMPRSLINWDEKAHVQYRVEVVLIMVMTDESGDVTTRTVLEKKARVYWDVEQAEMTKDYLARHMGKE
jgi:hypothetical protein